MYNKLYELIKKAEGNILTIELDEKLLEKFLKNDKVNVYSISSDKKSSIFSRSKKKYKSKGKSINIKKLRKYLNKKSVDYLFINMDGVFNYYKYIIKESIYLNKNMIYIYASNDIDKDFIIKRYKRYNVEINYTNYKTGYIIIINNKKGKNNKIKDFFYFIYDTLYNFAELLGNILVS